MKILIITQAVDRVHPILGFFHRWIEEFAKQCDSVTVIGQQVGDHALPNNVRVLSLGKEDGRSRPMQIMRFWWLLWRSRHDYDVVFVHMIALWVVLGAPLWMILRKRRYLWYEARGGGWALRIALRLVRRVFSASSHGMPRKTSKSIVVGHGIDTTFFSPADAPRDPHLIVTVGRVTAAKRLDVLLDAFVTLPAHMRLLLIGAPVTAADHAYASRLAERLSQEQIAERVTMHPLPHADIVPLLQRASLFLHAGHTGLDKAVLEAMACGCLVLSSGRAFQDLLPAECRADDAIFSTQLLTMSAMTPVEQTKLGMRLRAIIEQEHGLQRLVKRLLLEMA